MKKILLSLLVLCFLAACSAEKSKPINQTKEDGAKPQVTEMASDLKVPWSIQKHGDVFYISERPGSIMKIDGKKRKRQKANLSDPLVTDSEAGLLGFILSPDFAESNQAFAYYTYDDQGTTANKIVRLQVDGNQWQEIEVLLDQLPGGAFHDGGRLAIGPDEKLYASVGDAHDRQAPQDPDSLGGKILRMNFDGSIPADNPEKDSYVYSYGHRNVQGMVWDKDRMFASEHGDSANDEINEIKAGENYGWPEIEGEQSADGMERPLLTSGSDETWAPSGMDVWQGNLFVAALRGEAILKVNPEKEEVQPFIDDYGRIRDVLIAKDQLYFVTNNLDGRGNGASDDDKLYRIDLKTSIIRKKMSMLYQVIKCP